MYQRPGSDTKVAWTPPAALRKFGVIFVDETSQYTGTEWNRLGTQIIIAPASAGDRRIVKLASGLEVPSLGGTAHDAANSRA